MRSCLSRCKCTLTLKLFITAIFLYFLISCSLMVPSIREYLRYKAEMEALNSSEVNLFHCDQICNHIYQYPRQSTLCCNDPLQGRCFTKEECKVDRLQHLNNDEASALFDIKMGIGITVFSLIVLSVVFKNKYKDLVRRERQRRQDFATVFEQSQQGGLNRTLLKQNRSTIVYTSFTEQEKSQEACAICYQSMSQEKLIKLSCQHTFHSDCIREWLLKKSDCPICRADA